jgi:SAM-dependent methyltransferase
MGRLSRQTTVGVWHNRNQPFQTKHPQMALPDFKLNVEPSELAPLAARLAELNYTEAAVRELLPILDNGELIGDEIPHYQWTCESNPSDLATLVGFFLLGSGVSIENLKRLIGAETLRALMKCNAVLCFDGVFTSQVTLYPCQGRYFFTDYWYTMGHQTEGKIYEIGTDSYVLARTTPRVKVEKALDLCTGSGIHAILSASECESTAVDINPRALEYTRANAALNSVECGTHLGDLYTVLQPDESFDLITANPPFVPSPDPDVVLIHRSPGETGEEVSEKLVGGLRKRLNAGGLFSMILEYPVMEGDLYTDRLERWLESDGTGWGIAVLWYIEKTLGDYVVQHIGPVESYKETFGKYLQSYAKHGITAIRFANVFIKRLPPGTPNWKSMEKTLWPRKNVVDDIQVWLDALTTYNDPNWRPDPEWKPSISHYYKSFWRDWDDERGIIETADHNWIPSHIVDVNATEFMMRIKDGNKTISELQSEWLSDGMDEESFMTAIRSVGLLRALA